MPKNLQISDTRHTRLLKTAKRADFDLEKKGAAGETGAFLDWLFDHAPQPIEGKDAFECWAVFGRRLMPLLDELMQALARHGYSVESTFSLEQMSVHAVRRWEPQPGEAPSPKPKRPAK